MNLLKLIPLLLCVLALTIPTIVDARVINSNGNRAITITKATTTVNARRRNRNRNRNRAITTTTTTTTTTTSNPNLDSYGFPRFDYLKENSVTFINWTQSGHDIEDKDLLIQATCLERRMTSQSLVSSPHDFNIINGTEVTLPATGRDIDYSEGLYEKESCVGIRLIRHQLYEGSSVNHLLSEGAFPLYRNLTKVPTTAEGYTVIGTNCNKSKYYAYIKYIPVGQGDQPVDSEDPDGHYTLLESCR